MELRKTEHNYERIAYNYGLDTYEDKNGYNVFCGKTNEILLAGLPTENDVINEVIDVFNDNIRRKTYKKTKNRNDMFRWYYGR